MLCHHRPSVWFNLIFGFSRYGASHEQRISTAVMRHSDRQLSSMFFPRHAVMVAGPFFLLLSATGAYLQVVKMDMFTSGIMK